MTVLDASALLAFLAGERGAEVVEAALTGGAVVGAANWSEVTQKVLAGGHDWELAKGLLASYSIGIEPVTRIDAELAAANWRSRDGYSLGDRLCLALAARLGREVLTADRSWGTVPPVRQIR